MWSNYLLITYAQNEGSSYFVFSKYAISAECVQNLPEPPWNLTKFYKQVPISY